MKGAITTSAITTSAITTSAITTSAITTSAITTSAITTSAITTSAITTSAITTSAISYPGQYKNKFLCHTFNSVDWSLAEIKYDELNLSELVVFQVEFLPNNLAALHTLYKNNDGKFIRKLIAINREYLDCYKYIS